MYHVFLNDKAPDLAETMRLLPFQLNIHPVLLLFLLPSLIFDSRFAFEDRFDTTNVVVSVDRSTPGPCVCVLP